MLAPGIGEEGGVIDQTAQAEEPSLVVQEDVPVPLLVQLLTLRRCEERVRVGIDRDNVGVAGPRRLRAEDQEEKDEGQPESEDHPPAPRCALLVQDQLGWFRTFSMLFRTSREVTSTEV